MKGILKYDPRANKGGFYSLNIDGTYYSFGKTDPGVRKGDMVEFEVVQNGEYQNVKPGTLKKVDQAEPTQTGKPPVTNVGSTTNSGRQFPVPTRHGDRTIIRQNALTHATAIVLKTGSDLGSDLPGVANKVIGVAKILEAYSAGDEERRQDEAKKAQQVAAQVTGGGE